MAAAAGLIAIARQAFIEEDFFANGAHAGVNAVLVIVAVIATATAATAAHNQGGGYKNQGKCLLECCNHVFRFSRYRNGDSSIAIG